MGMYDYIVCRYPLPTVPPPWATPDQQYQSKSLDCRMDVYEIRDDGSLWVEDYDIEDRSERAKWKAKHPGEELPKELAESFLSLAGCMSRVNKRWVKQHFDGVVEFYHSNWSSAAYGMVFTPDGADHESVTYEATFVDGVVTKIVETEREREPALSREIYERLLVMAFDGDDEPVIDKSEPEVGAEMYVLWGSINRNLDGYPVKLVAKTPRDWAFVGQHDKIETINPAQLGNCLFHSEADAKAQRSWEHRVADRRQEYCKELLREQANREAPGRDLHWTEAEARAKNDVAQRRCIHGIPINVFCGRCES